MMIYYPASRNISKTWSFFVFLLKTYLQSMTVRLEEWRIKKRDTEEWMRHRQLPQDLQDRIRRFVQYKWLATRGVHEEAILQSLPIDLRREIQRHLCLNLVRRVCLRNLHFISLLLKISSNDVSTIVWKISYTRQRTKHLRVFIFVLWNCISDSFNFFG